ncbi:MAG: phosphoribosylanthranilate isomerase [Desulfobacterales bacterium]
MGEADRGGGGRGMPVQVKICGLTRPAQAAACAAAGASALGCVFYAASPRRVGLEQAAALRRASPPGVALVGVFVDETADGVLRAAAQAGLDAVQLHGAEPPETVARLGAEGLRVIKALFADREPSFARAAEYPASAFLLECGRGPLPGGNALAWEWGRARPLADRFPVILAGGVTPENVALAVEAARPDAVDVSSGVERRPGEKDIDRVRQLIAAAARGRARRRIFP